MYTENTLPFLDNHSHGYHYNLIYSPELGLTTLTFSHSGYCFACLEIVSSFRGKSSCGGCGSGERGRADILEILFLFICWRRLSEAVSGFGVNSLK